MTQPSFQNIKFDNQALWRFRKYLKTTKISREKCIQLLNTVIKNKEDICYLRQVLELLNEHDRLVNDQNDNIKMIRNEIKEHSASLA